MACTFHKGRAEGALEGSGWVALGEKDSVDAPTCGGQKVTSDLVCPAYTWPTEFDLCVSGSIPALPAMPIEADLKVNWGIMVGTKVSDIQGCTLAGFYRALKFSLSGSPQTNLRAIVHLRRDADQTTYCALVTPEAKGTGWSTPYLPFTSFNTRCWDNGSGTQLTQADVADIDKIGIQIYSVPSKIQVSDFCLQAIFLQ